jgi:hypothetical protein
LIYIRREVIFVPELADSVHPFFSQWSLNMKKHLFAIFTYSATFFISFFLVSFLTERPQTKATSCFPNRTVIRSVTTLETEQKSEIRNLLKRDQEFGLDYFVTNEQAKDTENLVKNMQSLDNPKLPVEVRKAYKDHIEAWSIYAKHLRKSENHDGSDRDCKIHNRGINETYNTLLLAAENYGVDFPY